MTPGWSFNNLCFAHSDCGARSAIYLAVADLYHPQKAHTYKTEDHTLDTQRSTALYGPDSQREGATATIERQA
jgi:hypothetical protein